MCSELTLPDLASQQFDLPVSKKMVHLGCGHDHVYHLLKFHLNKGFKKFFILNFDAHPDMRPDTTLHSGTPFRKFFVDHEHVIEKMYLWQVGLQKYYVDKSHLEVSGKKMDLKTTWMEEFDLVKWQNEFKEVSASLDSHTVLILSVDLDVLSSSEFSSVSAPNPLGMKRSDLFQIIRFLKPLPFQLGIYEFNPVISLSAIEEARYCACLIFEHIQE
jgi:arginase family enzyme